MTLKQLQQNDPDQSTVTIGTAKAIAPLFCGGTVNETAVFAFTEQRIKIQ